MIRSRAITLSLAVLAGVTLAGTVSAPALAQGACTPYGYMCYRAWNEKEQPGFLSRVWAPKGEYMGSLFLEDGRCSFLGLGWGCRPCEDVPVADWAEACNLSFAECQGRCFAR